jgi:hypothetical protein
MVFPPENTGGIEYYEAYDINLDAESSLQEM